jgi:hypothetical protein
VFMSIGMELGLGCSIDRPDGTANEIGKGEVRVQAMCNSRTRRLTKALCRNRVHRRLMYS